MFPHLSHIYVFDHMLYMFLLFVLVGVQHGVIHVDNPVGLPLEYSILPQELKKVGKISGCH